MDIKKQNEELSELSCEYWDEYYSARKFTALPSLIPSQFAAFCALELESMNVKQLIEVACGDGRDSVFFAEKGFQVLAVDSSASAIKLLKRRANNFKNLKINRIDAVNGKLSSDNFSYKAAAYYARFFIHTLPEAQLHIFFNNLSQSMRPGDYFFAEYRNEKDIKRTKVTPAHFRSFYTANFVKQLAKNGFLSCIYEVEGTGLAKYKADDAYVTRQIFVKDNK